MASAISSCLHFLSAAVSAGLPFAKARAARPPVGPPNREQHGQRSTREVEDRAFAFGDPICQLGSTSPWSRTDRLGDLTSRATIITAHIKAAGTVENAQAMAANEHNLNQMTRAERFLLLHKELEAQIRRRLHLARSISYSDLLNKMVEAGDITVRENQDFLNSLRELRNILSHASYGPGHIAEPSQEALEKFGAIVKRIAQPPLMRDVASKPVKVFQETDTLLAALIDMKANDYSQIVIRRSGRLGLVTPEGITHWILRESDSVGLLEPAAASIREVGAHEPKASCRLMKADQTVDEARAALLNGSSRPSTRLYAILVTHTAKSTEEPLGIVTPWDVFDR